MFKPLKYQDEWLTVVTVKVADIYSTGISHPGYNAGQWITVQETFPSKNYDADKCISSIHNMWVVKMTEGVHGDGVLPERLVDVDSTMSMRVKQEFEKRE